MRRLVQTLLLIAALGFSTSALAQSAIRYNEGPGIWLTDGLVLHPGAAFETRYDTNALFTNSAQVKGAPYLRIIGHLQLATGSKQRRTEEDGTETKPGIVDFRFNAAVAYREYLSGGAAVTAQRGLDVDAGISALFLPQRVVSFEIGDDFQRSVNTLNFAVTATGPVPNSTFALDNNTGRAKVYFRPGGGRLEFALGYRVHLSAYEEAGFSRNNRIFHAFSLDSRYRFLPKTAVFLLLEQRIYDYYKSTGAAGDNSNSKPFRVAAGLNGLLTPKISVVVQGGFGAAIYDSGTSYTSFLAKAQIGYQFMENASLKAGYERSFEDSPFGNYYQDDVAYLQYEHTIMDRFVLGARPSYSYRIYDGFENVPGIASYSAHLFSVDLNFDWRIQEWVYVGVGYDMALQDTSIGAGGAVSIFNLNDFIRHQVFGKVGFSY